MYNESFINTITRIHHNKSQFKHGMSSLKPKDAAASKRVSVIPESLMEACSM
jgi:hypothetical protein